MRLRQMLARQCRSWTPFPQKHNSRSLPLSAARAWLVSWSCSSLVFSSILFFVEPTKTPRCNLFCYVENICVLLSMHTSCKCFFLMLCHFQRYVIWTSVQTFITSSTYGFPQKWSRLAMWYHTSSLWDHTKPMWHYYPKPSTRIHLWICKLLPKKVQQWQKLPSGQVSSSFNQSKCACYIVLFQFHWWPKLKKPIAWYIWMSLR